MLIKFVQTPLFDLTLIAPEPLGTTEDVYPVNNVALLIPVAKADVYPSTSEKRLKGPVSAPAVVSCIVTVIYYCF